MGFDKAGALARGKPTPVHRPNDVRETLPFPQMKIPLQNSPDVPPYLAGWQAESRIHECLAADPYSLVTTFGDKDRQKRVADWLKEFFFFDLCDYPEYWGGAVLIAPNPLFRAIEWYLKNNPENKSEESVVCRLHPRKGKDLTGLEITCMERESGHVIALPYQEPGISFDFGHFLEDTAAIVKCPQRGFLYRNDFTSWIRSIHANIQMMGNSYQFEVVDKETKKTEQILVTPTTSVPSIVGDPNDLSPTRKEAFRRKQRRDGEKMDQRWFDGEEGREKAKEKVRSILKTSRFATLIVDPYFGAYELGHYGLANGDWKVEVRILTSAEFLRKIRKGTAALNYSQLAKLWECIKSKFTKNAKVIDEEGDALWNFQEFLTEKLGFKGKSDFPVEIRVMPGESPPVHDRFISVDNRVWLLGSSLNEFGKRGTMLLQLPDPDPVRENLERYWDTSIPLRDWVAERRVSRKNRAK